MNDRSMNLRALVARTAALAGLALGVMGTPAVVLAQEFPVKPVRITVPFPPGGNSDILTRIVAAELQKPLGQPVVVENRPGAGGTIGAAFVAKAPADGYTLFLNTAGTHGIATTLYASLPYDAIRDFAPITNVASAPLLFLAGGSGPFKTLPQLIAAAKSRPGEAIYGSAGIGSSGHMATELFLMLAGLKMIHVPYKGGNLAAQDLMAGQVVLVLDQIPASIGFVKSGRMRALAISTAKRSPLLPDVPTAAEAGVPGYAAQSWFGLVAPAGTPAPVIKRMHAETTRVLADAQVRERIFGIGMEPIGNTPEEFAAFIRSEIERWGKVVRASGAKAE
jgi:tripartite-type tricarboxylate transporter receptor subunit TctC